jgi:hypothetical protein
LAASGARPALPDVLIVNQGLMATMGASELNRHGVLPKKTRMIGRRETLLQKFRRCQVLASAILSVPAKSLRRMSRPRNVDARMETHGHTGTVAALTDEQGRNSVDIEMLTLATQDDFARLAGDDRRRAAEMPCQKRLCLRSDRSIRCYQQ